jgi:hypothetical protein
MDPLVHLEEIRNFGGINGLRDSKKKTQQKTELQALYTGLRLRVDVFFTHKPVIDFLEN